MTLFTHIQQCPECLPQEDHIPWRELPINETLREFVRTYVSPPIVYYATLSEALSVWGQDIKPEDLICQNSKL